MKITAAPSPRDTNNERLFLFQWLRGSTPELALDAALKREEGPSAGDDRRRDLNL